LVTAARAVIESGPEDRLYVEPLWEGGGLEFVFSPAEQYGQPAGIP
jgi:hypothetical protein